MAVIMWGIYMEKYFYEMTSIERYLVYQKADNLAP